MDVESIMRNIKDKIRVGTLDTMKEINDVCYNNSFGLDLWEVEWMRGQMLAVYLIQCELKGKVPVSGYVN